MTEYHVHVEVPARLKKPRRNGKYWVCKGPEHEPTRVGETLSRLQTECWPKSLEPTPEDAFNKIRELKDAESKPRVPEGYPILREEDL